MLRAHAAAFSAQAVDDCARQLARQEGVLAEALEVAPAAGIPVDVDRRAEHEGRVLRECLVGEFAAQAGEQRRVPRCAVAGRVGEADCGAVASQVVVTDATN